jgi:integrase
LHGLFSRKGAKAQRNFLAGFQNIQDSANGKQTSLRAKDEAETKSLLEGRHADFHALRYTWATFMRKHGISDNFARKQMRHQNIKQTDGYTDEA